MRPAAGSWPRPACLGLASLLATAAAAAPADRGLEVSGRQRVAVTIGIDAYPERPLRSAVADARRVAAALRALGFQVYELHDAQATGAQITHLFRQALPNLLGPDGQLVVFFAGHGHTDRPGAVDAMGYLIPVDGSLSDPRAAVQTGISMASLAEWVSERWLRARHVLLLVDACYAGLALPGTLRSAPAADLAWAAHMPSTVVLTAGSDGETAAELPSGGLFTTVVVEALGSRSADRNRDGYLTSSELARYVDKEVPRRARRLGHSQSPQFARVGAGDFVVSLTGKPLPKHEAQQEGMVLVGAAPGASRKGRRTKALLMDTTEVTVGAFRRCVEDGVCRADGLMRHPLCNAGRPGTEQHPVNCVTLEQAHQYCRWRRKRLPTEAEWRRAAAPAGYERPWGNERADCRRAVMYGEPGRGCGAKGTQPVATRVLGRSVHGIYDLVGNVREWVVPNDAGEPFSPKPHLLAPVLGGAWQQGERLQRADAAVQLLAGDADEFTGFRCVVER